MALAEREFELFEKCYPQMSFTRVVPIKQKDGSIKYPTKEDFLKAVNKVATTSQNTQYFSVYFTGCALVENGHWVFPKANNQSSGQLSPSMTDLVLK